MVRRKVADIVVCIPGVVGVCAFPCLETWGFSLKDDFFHVKDRDSEDFYCLG